MRASQAQADALNARRTGRESVFAYRVGQCVPCGGHGMVPCGVSDGVVYIRGCGQGYEREVCAVRLNK